MFAIKYFIERFTDLSVWNAALNTDFFQNLQVHKFFFI